MEWKVLIAAIALFPSGIMAWATWEMSAATDQLAELEEQRDTIDLEMMAIQKIDRNGSQWGFAIANHGLRDVGIGSIEVNLDDGDTEISLGGIAIEKESQTNLNGRVVPGGGWAWAEISIQEPIDPTNKRWETVEFQVNPIKGEPDRCLVTDRSALQVLEAGNPLTFLDSSCENKA